MSAPRDSYCALVDSLRRNPLSVAILPDSHLLKVARFLPRDGALAAPVVGELLVRQWLYRGEFSGLFAKVLTPLMPEACRKAAGEILLGLQAHERAPVVCITIPDGLDAFEKGILCHFKERISGFQRSHGLIATVSEGACEAVAIPFTIIRRPSSGLHATDDDAVRIPKWSAGLARLRDVLKEKVAISICCSCGDYSSRMVGDSFMLPVAVAFAKLTGNLPDHSPLQVIATGGVKSNGVEPVEGLDVKIRLAEKLGAVFIAPECVKSPRSLALPVGKPHVEWLGLIEGFLRDQGVVGMTPAFAVKSVDRLCAEVHEGIVSMDEAKRKLDQYSAALSGEQDDPWIMEGKIQAMVLKGSIANHSGEAQEALEYLREASRCCESDPVLYARCSSNQIVTLTDLGDYDAAETLGRSLLGWIGRDFRGKETDRRLCEMMACGVLGGQPLLCKALVGANTGLESHELLLKTFELAKKLHLHSDVCRDAVQIALWHALLRPEKIQEACAVAAKCLGEYPLETHRVSTGYLNRVRFLGGFRSLLKSGAVMKGFNKWPLPEETIGHMGWVLGAALKYRGALFAASDRPLEAKADFDQALGIFDRTLSPLLRFIGGTVALQAAESLHSSMDTSGYTNRAKSVFSAFEGWFSGPISGKKWLERTIALKRNGRLGGGSGPQQGFPY